jgi:hypothetical protein
MTWLSGPLPVPSYQNKHHPWADLPCYGTGLPCENDAPEWPTLKLPGALGRDLRYIPLHHRPT